MTIPNAPGGRPVGGSGRGSASHASNGPSDRPFPIYEDEESKASGLWTDLESRVTGECASMASSRAPSRSSAASAPAWLGFKEARAEIGAATTAPLPSEPKKSHVSSRVIATKEAEKKTARELMLTLGGKKRGDNDHFRIKTIAGSEKKSNDTAKGKDIKKSFFSAEKDGKRPRQTSNKIFSLTKDEKFPAISEATRENTNINKANKPIKAKAAKSKSNSAIRSSGSRAASALATTSSLGGVTLKKRLILDDESNYSRHSFHCSSYSGSFYDYQNENEIVREQISSLGSERGENEKYFEIKKAAESEKKKANDEAKGKVVQKNFSNGKIGSKRPSKTSTSIFTLAKGKNSLAMSGATRENTSTKKATGATKAKAIESMSNGSMRSIGNKLASAPVIINSSRGCTPKKRLISDNESRYTCPSSSYSGSFYDYKNENKIENSTMHTDAPMHTFAPNAVSVEYSENEIEVSTVHTNTSNSSYSESCYESKNENESEYSTMHTDASKSASVEYESMIEDSTMHTDASYSVSFDYSSMIEVPIIHTDASNSISVQYESMIEDSTMHTDTSYSVSVDYSSMNEGPIMHTDASNSVSVQYDIMDSDHQLQVTLTGHDGAKTLVVQEVGCIPTPNSPDQIVILVHCSTITLRDCMICCGRWSEVPKLPFVPGTDIVGTIFSMGEEASKCSTFQRGDKVAAVVPSGGNAKYITLPYQSIIRVPNETNSITALCLSSAYVPAREALDLARKSNTPFTGANVLVIGGNDPSGLAAIELALLEGANVFTTADERHHGYLSLLGAECFPIDPEKWLPVLRGKMDVVLDSLCLDGYESSSLALNSVGTLVCTGMSAVYTQGQAHSFGTRDLWNYKAMYYRMKAKYMLGRAIYYDRMERYNLASNEYAQHFLYLCHVVSRKSLKPQVASRSPLDLVASTQRAIEHGSSACGVCVCTPWTTKVGPYT